MDTIKSCILYIRWVHNLYYCFCFSLLNITYIVRNIIVFVARLSVLCVFSQTLDDDDEVIMNFSLAKFCFVPRFVLVYYKLSRFHCCRNNNKFSKENLGNWVRVPCNYPLHKAILFCSFVVHRLLI